MPSGQRQVQKQQQKLSPQQLQLMKMLSLPVTELQQLIREELEQNPMLEVNEDNAGQEANENMPETNGDRLTDNNPSNNNYEDEEDNYPDTDDSVHEPRYNIADSSTDICAQRLTDQLRMLSLTDKQMLIGQEIIGSIDTSGYLSRDLPMLINDLAFQEDIDVTLDEANQVLRIIQSFDPPGLAARSLQECLSLQLHRLCQNDNAIDCAIRIVDTYFDYFINHRYEQLQQKLSTDEKSLKQAIHIIQNLNPKPGSGSSQEMASLYLHPDFVVTFDQNRNCLSLTLTNDNLPPLQMSKFYDRLLDQLNKSNTNSATDHQTIDYLNSKKQSAQQFIDTISQRHQTLYVVASAIIQAQSQYFKSGNREDLKPLLQKDIAQATNYDDSTISRIVNSKNIQTDFGIIPLKECFSTSIQTQSGEEITNHTVQQRIAYIIQTENKRQPLTDDAIARMLANEGYNISRRSVTKYRKLLQIPTGRLRKEL
ncbi:MAG: RNA polymerase factor sigma-54 [Bacteroidales bacterium]|nr:RNA polymerase factor sigma-54 [Candidatus Colimorpha onthohippi]